VKLVLATQNEGKIQEIKLLLQRPGLEILSLSDLPDLAPEVIEDGATFEDNARKKAIEIAKWSNLPALADDSGLLVDTLDGKPGVESARFAGIDGDSEANMAKLLSLMKSFPDGERQARFKACIVVAAPDGRTWEVEGSVEGLITREKRGQGGFGYDPVFFYPELRKTFAEIDPAEKNIHSHRGKALKSLVNIFPEIEKELEK